MIRNHPIPTGNAMSARSRWIAWLAMLLLLATAGAARADDDLPGRVGRLADAAGGVFLAPQDASSDWAEIGVNYPIISGDNVWASAGGRAEVDYGGGQFRLAGATNIHVSRLDDRQLALFVAEGAVILRVRALDPGDVVRIDAPTAQVQIARPGLYRIEVVPDQLTTTLTVREGEALVSLQSGVTQALPGQTVSIVGQDPAVADLRGGVGVDGFDVWSADRDRYYERNRSVAYVSPQMVGAAELDQYGAWQTYPDYGAVWFPHAVPYGWAPYADGYWINVGPWGATWVDAAPWGYAPSHYGRWAWIGGRWGWCPGGYVARPIWAPALVAWRGGPGWGLSASYGTPVYGWVPLGWRDPYIPPWNNCSSRCWTLYNQPYGVALRERPRAMPTTWSNLNVPGAVTAVPGHALTASRSIASERIRVPVQTASAAPALASAPTMPPMRTRTPASTINAALPPAAGSLRPGQSRSAYAPPTVPATMRSSNANVPTASATTAPGARRAPGRPQDPAAPAPYAGRMPGTRPTATDGSANVGTPAQRPEGRSYYPAQPSAGNAPPPAHAMPSPRPERVAPPPQGGQPGMPMPSGMVVAPAPAGVPAAVPVAPQGAVVAPGTPVHRAAPVAKDPGPASDSPGPGGSPQGPPAPPGMPSGRGGR